MKQVRPNVYYVTGLPVGRVYVLEDPDGLTVIDASVPGQTGHILKQIADLGRKPADVRRILLTHAHPDHVGSLPELKAATGAELITSAIERPVVEGKQTIARTPPEDLGWLKLRPPSTMLKATPVDRELNGGEVLPVLGGLQAVFTPGHAPGHLAFWQPERKLLFCGDVMFHIFGVDLPFAFLTVDMAENRRSIRKLADLNPAVVCFGHGDPLTENAAAQVRVLAEREGV